MAASVLESVGRRFLLGGGEWLELSQSSDGELDRLSSSLCPAFGRRIESVVESWGSLAALAVSAGVNPVTGSWRGELRARLDRISPLVEVASCLWRLSEGGLGLRGRLIRQDK